jgi:hypothetical protein
MLIATIPIAAAEALAADRLGLVFAVGSPWVTK